MQHRLVAAFAFVLATLLTPIQSAFAWVGCSPEYGFTDENGDTRLMSDVRLRTVVRGTVKKWIADYLDDDGTWHGHYETNQTAPFHAMYHLWMTEEQNLSWLYNIAPWPSPAPYYGKSRAITPEQSREICEALAEFDFNRLALPLDSFIARYGQTFEKFGVDLPEYKMVVFGGRYIIAIGQSVSGLPSQATEIVSLLQTYPEAAGLYDRIVEILNPQLEMRGDPATWR